MEQIINYFESIDPILAAFYATLFTWGLTALGASLVFLFKGVNRAFFDGMLGFTGGVMVAASFWSLLAPGIEMSPGEGFVKVIPAVVGFGLGALFLFGLDKVLPHLHINFKESEKEGVKTPWHKTTLLVLAITLHNIPEGLAVGVAFGFAASAFELSPTGALTPEIIAAIGGAIALAVGIGLQNFPEGAAVSVPLRREGMSRKKAFFIGQFSGMVEPVAGVIGAVLALSMRNILPYSLSFAAGAMIYVVIEELIPESQMMETTKIATIGAMIGFTVMMMLDVALG